MSMSRLIASKFGCVWSVALGLLAAAGMGPAALADEPATLATGLKNPESVAIDAAGKVYVSAIGDFDKDGDGSVVTVADGKATPFAEGLNDPKGLAFGADGTLYVADKNKVCRIDAAGQATVFADTAAFPQPPKFLNDVAVDAQGNVFVSDSGGFQEGGGAVFKISPEGQVSVVLDAAKLPALKAPNGLAFEDPEHLMVNDVATGDVHRVGLVDGKISRYVTGHPSADGLAFDANGKMYLSEWGTGRVFVFGKEDHSPTQLPGKFEASADFAYDAANNRLVVPDMLAGSVAAISLAELPAVERNESPLPVEIERAFPNVTVNRPILLTHAGDDSNRVFVASQLGKIYVMPNKQDVVQPKLFLDIESKVKYKENENEESLLGMAFHPKFKENGQFYLYYSTKDAPLTAVISRFRVNKKDPDVADPASEVEIMRIVKPFWNHTGGTLAFGPDGYLYIGLGDGGKGNDPFGHGQDLKNLLGSILRIDVDHKTRAKGKSKAKNYAIPKDNPFLDYPGACPEIYAYGVRNIWRLSFDRKTGDLWAADVGQDLWEEIDIVRKGDNLGWNLREGKHKFGTGGVENPREDIVEPIHDYHHDVGKSITGGAVYRGKRVPALAGMYVYADYVSGKVWALKYDKKKKVVTENRPILGNVNPIMSFGEDESGDLYYMTTQGELFRFKPAGEAAAK